MKIPVGNFGFATAPVAPPPNVPEAAFIVGGGRDLAQSVGEIAQVEGSEEKRRIHEATQESKRQALQAEHERRETASLRARSQATRDLETAAHDVQQGLTEGTLSKDDAAKVWEERSKKAVMDAAPLVQPQHQALYQAEMLGHVNRLDNKVRDAITTRTHHEIRGDLLAIKSNYLRQAQDGDINGATREWEAIVDARGPSAGLTPEQIQTEKQSFREHTRYTLAYSMIDSTPDNVAALKATQKQLAGADFADLDPQRRAALDHTLRSRIEVVERRIAIQAEANARRLDREFQAFSTFHDKGITPSAEYATQVASRFKGTVYGPAVQQMLNSTPENAGFATLPLTKQQAVLDTLVAQRNEKGTNPAESARYDRLERVHKQTLEDVKADPLGAAAERGVLRGVAPLELSLDGPSFAEQLDVRRKQAEIVTSWTGKATSPFRPDEAKWIAGELEKLPAEQRATWLGDIGRAVGSPAQMRAFAQQVGTKSSTIATAAMLSANNLKTTRGRSIAELYLKGEEALREKTAKIDPAAETGIKAQIYRELEDVYSTPPARDMAADVAMKLYAQLKHEGNDSVSTALDLATGGITKFNGAKVPKPYGWSDSEFRDAATKLSAREVQQFAGGDAVIVGGKRLTAAEFAAQIPGARLRSYGNNEYAVQIGSFIAQRADGAPLAISLTRPNER